MNVKNEINIYEKNGKDVIAERAAVTIKSHWSRDEFVVLVVDGTSVTVSASDLRKAIQNATNK